MHDGKQGEILLFGTSACHLCEQAEDMLARIVVAMPGTTYRIVDISESDALFDRYGWIIPVVRFADASEMNWPFDEASVVARLHALDGA